MKYSLTYLDNLKKYSSKLYIVSTPLLEIPSSCHSTDQSFTSFISQVIDRIKDFCTSELNFLISDQTWPVR